MLEPQGAARLDSVVRALATAGKALRLYPASSPIPRQSVQSAEETLDQYFRDGDAIREGKRLAQKHYTAAVKPATTAFLRASKVAHTTSKNAALSKTAQAAAVAVSKELLRHVGVWNTIKYDDFDEVLQRWQQGVDLWRGRLKGNLLSLERMLDALDDDPKLAKWDNDLTQAFRSVGNSLGNNPEFKDIWPTWQPWDGLHHTKHPKLQGKSTPKEEALAIKSVIATTRPHLNQLKVRIGA